MNKAQDKDFIHLHVHTDASNLRMSDSIVKVKDAIQYADKLGNRGLAITDHECLSNHVEAINIVNDLKKANQIANDFKLILGNEIYLLDKHEMRELQKNKEKIVFYHCLLLAKDKIGHEQLRELSSRAWRDNYLSYRGMNRVPTFYSDIEEVIEDNKGHLIMSTACIGSLLGNLSTQLMTTEDETEQLNIKGQMADFIEWGLDWFGEDFYLEMQPNTSDEQKFYNNLLIKISNSYNISLIITTDVHFIDEETREAHKAFLTSDDNSTNREVDYFYETTRFFKTEEIYEYMNYIDNDIITKAIFNTMDIRNKIKDYDWFASPKIPLTPLPNKEEWFPIDINTIKQYPNIYKLYEDKYIYHTYLIHKIFEGIEYRNIPIEDIEGTLNRVDLECGELVGISERLQEPVGAYLTTMKKNMDIIWNISVVGCGRGSAVGWIINYLLDITQINPLKQEGMKLQHWRFLSKSRPDMPKQYWALVVNPTKGCVA